MKKVTSPVKCKVMVSFADLKKNISTHDFYKKIIYKNMFEESIIAFVVY